MIRIVIEIGLVVGAFVLGMEAVHYRSAVVACNVENKRAWHIVQGLRDQKEALESRLGIIPEGASVPTAVSGQR
ncbi:MAG TPA: hypothetical protein VH083_16215 [Myxococcales bacterium]|jgi:hypothetical protein|nr:hypothetical protein [Myxococcales bacterium]